MKQGHSQVTEKPAVCVTGDGTNVRIGAMTPSFPPARQRPESRKECDTGR
jgi:hypothetical protein